MVTREEVNDTTGEMYIHSVLVALYGSWQWNKTCFICLRQKKKKKKKKGSYISTIRFLDSGTKAMKFGPLDHYVCKKSTLKLGNY